MPKQKLEIECPVCDAKLSIDARSCPKCGADLGMADFQDLEKLANDISGGSTTFDSPTVKETAHVSDPSPEPASEEPAGSAEGSEQVKDKAEPEADTQQADKPKEEKKEDEEPADEGKKKGLFSKFFGKKK